MKILQVVPSLAVGFGGPTNVVLGVSGALCQLGHAVTIFTTDADVNGRLNVPLNTPIDIDGIKVFHFPVQGLRHYKFSLPLYVALRKNIPLFDIVHIHSLFQFSTLAAAYCCRRFYKPYIISPLGQLDPYALRRHLFCKSLYLNIFERKNLEDASAIHFTTEQERWLTESLGLKTKSMVVGLGVDLDEFTKLPEYGTFRSRYAKLRDKKIILFLSRINFKKGLDILVKAFANLSRQREDLHLVIAGPDNEGYGRKVKWWLKKEGILDKTTFTGMLLGVDKLAAFRDSDIFVLPSYSENFGLTVIEAMASGIPIVISNKIGIYREVQKNNAGIIIECDETNLYEAIKSILENKRLAEELSFNGRKLVEKYYNIDNVAEHLVKAYKELLNKK